MSAQAPSILDEYDKAIKDLQEDKASLKNIVKNLETQRNGRDDLIQSLQSKLAIAEKALEKYGDVNLWLPSDGKYITQIVPADAEYSHGFYFGGRTAREALAQIKQSKGSK